MRERVAAALLLAFTLAGCGIFSRKPNRYYSLQSLPANGTTPVAGAARTPIGIEGVELPPGLDRRSIVIRRADHRLEVRGNELWAGPLEEMVIHTLSFDLAKRLPEGSVVLPGQAKPSVMRGLYLVFEELAAREEEKQFVLDGRWILRAANGEVRGQERIAVPLQSMESADVVAGKSEALAQLAERIAASSRR